MIILRTMSQLEAATLRAIAKKPRLRVKAFGVYEVSGSHGNWYTVTCKKDGLGQRLMYCTCEDATPRRANTACYHLVPALGAHILLALAKESVEIVYDEPK